MNIMLICDEYCGKIEGFMFNSSNKYRAHVILNDSSKSFWLDLTKYNITKEDIKKEMKKLKTSESDSSCVTWIWIDMTED